MAEYVLFVDEARRCSVAILAAFVLRHPAMHRILRDDQTHLSELEECQAVGASQRALRALVQSEHQTLFELTGKGFEKAARWMVQAGLTHGFWACCDGRFSEASQKIDCRTGRVMA